MSGICDGLKLNYDVFYCQEFDEDEYDQVWIVAAAFMLISLGSTLSNFSQFAQGMTVVNGGKYFLPSFFIFVFFLKLTIFS